MPSGAGYLQDLLALPDVPTCYQTSPFCTTVCQSHLHICKGSGTVLSCTYASH